MYASAVERPVRGVIFVETVQVKQNGFRWVAWLACASALAFGQAANAGQPVAPDAVPVVRGAQWVSSTSHPSSFTVDMRTLPMAPSWKSGDPILELPRTLTQWSNHNTKAAQVPVPLNPVFGSDPLAAIQKDFQAQSVPAFSPAIVNIDALANSNIHPNDPSGDIGLFEYVAAINSITGAQFATYAKSSGATIAGPTLMSSLAPGGNPCAAGGGNPVVLFDELASRWLFTESAQNANVLCVYLSSGANLSGVVTWTRYHFVLPSLPDAPRYGVWPDAYYVGANENGAVYALDRQRMLAGQSATLQRFSLPSLSGFNFQLLQPADLVGTNPPPVGSPGIFMRHRDDEVHNPGSNNATQDFLEVYELHVDFLTPGSSTITGPLSLNMAEISSNLNGLTGTNAFPQPSGQKLDPARENVMHRLSYRNLGSHEVLVGNLVTDLFLGAGSNFTDDTGAIRWFELRRPLGPQDLIHKDGFENPAGGPPGSWVLHQAGTFAPADGAPAEQADRWMAATSIDGSGNIAMGYSIVRQTPAISAGLRYTGRLATDPLGVMTAGEKLIVDGSGSVPNERWGNHADMGVDPSDGCTFWFIGNYANGGARANRAASFRFDQCVSPDFVLTTPETSVSVCANSPSPANAPPITINATANSTFFGAVSLIFPGMLPTGVGGSFSPQVIPSLPGSATLQLTATNQVGTSPLHLTARGESGDLQHDLQLILHVATASPTQPVPLAPADNAAGVGAMPTFSWSGNTAQAASYLVEASTSPSFATTLFSQTASFTSLLSPVALPTNQQIYWRVRANNVCGATNSVVFTYNVPAFTLTTTTPSVALCASTSATTNAPPITLALQPVHGFAGSAILSYPNPFAVGISGTLTPNNPNVPGSSVAQLAATNAAPSGVHNVPARAVSGPITRNLTLTLNLTTALPAAPSLTAPPNPGTGVSTSPIFSWAASAQASSYLVEASTTNNFSSLLFSQSTTATSLVSPVSFPPNTQIFWRVRATNICGTGADSAVSSFTTASPQEFCRNVSIPIPDENANGVNDNLVISGATGLIGDLDVRVELNHTYVADLALRLSRAGSDPRGLMNMPTSVPSGLCDGNDLAATFDDETSPPRPANGACVDGAVPTYAGLVTPEQPLNFFDGQNPNATWTLNVSDSVFRDLGTLTRWCITLR